MDIGAKRYISTVAQGKKQYSNKQMQAQVLVV